jgi:hypothetical protein
MEVLHEEAPENNERRRYVRDLPIVDGIGSL